MKSRFIPFSVPAAARLALVAFALTPALLLAQQPSDAPASAQDQQGPPPARGGHGNPAERQAHMLQRMTKRLNLSPDQVSQIKGIQTDTTTQEQALRSDPSSKGPDRRSKMMDLHKAEHDKISAVLNDDQRSKWAAMEEKHQDRMQGGQGNSAPPPPPAQ